jgi:thioredoxin-related protein
MEAIQIEIEYITDITSDVSSAEDLTTLAEKHKVLMFSKTNCPYCVELKRTLGKLLCADNSTFISTNITKN